MGLEGIALTAITAEMQQLVNSRISRIYQPSHGEIVLHCRRPGSNLVTVLSADPHNARAHLAMAVPDNPLNPPPFCMLLRKYLVGGRILTVVQPDLERILEIGIENIAADGSPAQYRLVTEIMSRHSNIILLNESGTVLDGINRVDSRVNRHREILPGVTYVRPPDQHKISPLLMDWPAFLGRMAPASPKARLSRLILDNFAGIGPRTAKELVHRAGYSPDSLRLDIDAEGLKAIYRCLLHLAETLEGKEFEPQVLLDAEGRPQGVSAISVHHLSGTAQVFDSMSLAVETYYSSKIAEEKIANWRRNLSRVIERHQRRVAKKLEAQRAALEEAEEADSYRVLGELLTANLYRVEKRMDAIAVPNFYDSNQAQITIPLDPRLTPSGNAQAYFHRYNKAKKTRTAGLYQFNRTMDEKKYLDQVQSTLDLATDISDIMEIQRELTQEGYMRPSQRQRHKHTVVSPPQPLRFRSQDGLEILVGRNNRQNDHVTFKLGRSEDMWLHVKDIPGSHVIIRGRGGTIPENTLQEAALLAAYYSKARTGQNVPVDYTLRRYVRKLKGSKPGMVIYDGHNTLFVSPRPEIITPILERKLGNSQ